VLMASGLARANPLLIQIMADVLDRPVEVPEIAYATAVGAAIHGAVAAGTVASYAEGAERFGARSVGRVFPRGPQAQRYQEIYDIYRGLSDGKGVHAALHALHALKNETVG
jgi:L-ribulokinase